MDSRLCCLSQRLFCDWLIYDVLHWNPTRDRRIRGISTVLLGSLITINNTIILVHSVIKFLDIIFLFIDKVRASMVRSFKIQRKSKSKNFARGAKIIVLKIVLKNVYKLKNIKLISIFFSFILKKIFANTLNFLEKIRKPIKTFKRAANLTL